MQDKLIIESNLHVDLSDDTKQDLIKQMIGSDFKDASGNAIGKILGAKSMDGMISIRAEITDRYYITHIREGDIKRL